MRKRFKALFASRFKTRTIVSEFLDSLHKSML